MANNEGPESGLKMVRKTCVEEMISYDSLPPEIRRSIAECVNQMSPTSVLLLLAKDHSIEFLIDAIKNTDIKVSNALRAKGIIQ